MFLFLSIVLEVWKTSFPFLFCFHFFSGVRFPSWDRSICIFMFLRVTYDKHYYGQNSIGFKDSTPFVYLFNDMSILIYGWSSLLNTYIVRPYLKCLYYTVFVFSSDVLLCVILWYNSNFCILSLVNTSTVLFHQSSKGRFFCSYKDLL